MIQRAGRIIMIQDGVVGHDRWVAIINRSNLGSFAILTAILLASSLVSNLAAERRPGSSSKYT